jgi:hypothetical protein
MIKFKYIFVGGYYGSGRHGGQVRIVYKLSLTDMLSRFVIILLKNGLMNYKIS